MYTMYTFLVFLMFETGNLQNNVFLSTLESTGFKFLQFLVEKVYNVYGLLC